VGRNSLRFEDIEKEAFIGEDPLVISEGKFNVFENS